jgi:hypothetical protein
MVEDLLAGREIIVSHEAVRCWAETFGRIDASKICRHAPQFGDKWHLDEVVISINGKKHWLWRAVDADGLVLDALVQGRRARRAAEQLLRMQSRTLRVMGLDHRGGELASADAAAREDHEAVQIRPTPPAPLLQPRSDSQPPQLSPPRHVVIRRSSASLRSDGRVARHRRTGHRRMAPGDSAPLRMAPVRRVDSTVAASKFSCDSAIWEEGRGRHPSTLHGSHAALGWNDQTSSPARVSMPDRSLNLALPITASMPQSRRRRCPRIQGP